MSQGGGGGLGGSLTVLGGVGVLEERGAAGGPRGGGVFDAASVVFDCSGWFACLCANPSYQLRASQ